MNKANPLRVAVLVDLLRSPQAGGHVKCWERLAESSRDGRLPLDLTVYFLGRAPDEIIGPHTRLRHLPPVFSTSSLKFMPYVPDHTDLSPWHPRLARELTQYDVIHTTDGYFAFARTAVKVAKARGIPLTNSFHTDTPNYARIFTQQTIEKIFGTGALGRKMIEGWKWPEKQGRAMERKLRQHLVQCRHVLGTRHEDHALAESILGPERVHNMRRGIDKEMFGMHRRDREGVERDYGIPPGRLLVLFVGRVDIGKNIYTLTHALEKLLAEGCLLHLLVAGVGPAMEDVKKMLGPNVSTPGFIPPAELARLYASADVLAVPSEVEIHSMVGMEAITSGCPTLIAGKSGVAQLFNGTPAMHIVDSGAEAWITVLRDFARRPEKREMMHKAALDYTRDHLASWREVLAEDMLTVWRRAMAENASQRKAA